MGVNSKRCPPLTALLNAYAYCILLWLSRWDCCLEKAEDGEGEGGLSDHLPPWDQHASEGQAPEHCPCPGECCNLTSWPSSVLWVEWLACTAFLCHAGFTNIVFTPPMCTIVFTESGEDAAMTLAHSLTSSHTLTYSYHHPRTPSYHHPHTPILSPLHSLTSSLLHILTGDSCGQ